MAQAQSVLDDAAAEFAAARSRGDANAIVKLLGVRLNALRLLGDFAGAFPKAGTTIDARSVTINALGSMSKEQLLALAAGEPLDA